MKAPHSMKTQCPIWLAVLICLGSGLFAQKASGAAGTDGIGKGLLPKDRPPNIVFIFTDDQSYDTIGAFGNSVVRTPNIDRIVSEGVNFKQGFVTTSICCVSRASMYVGQYQKRHGIDNFGKSYSDAQIKASFPYLLRQAGYKTAFMGKHGVGNPASFSKIWDAWYGFPQNIQYKVQVDGEPRYLTTEMETRAIHFLEGLGKDQPFLLVMALKEPHGPNDYFDPEWHRLPTDTRIPTYTNMTKASFDKLPPSVKTSLSAQPEFATDPKKFTDWARDRYDYISRADLAIGRIDEALKKNGLYDNTVVVISADNGVMDGAHCLDGKWLMYEESIHVPYIVRVPFMKEASGERMQPVLNIDFAPTFLSWAGVPVPPEMQGVDITPWLKNPNLAGRKDWYYEHTFSTGRGRAAIPASEGVRDDRYKLIHWEKETAEWQYQLFDLKTDPHEEHDLAHDPEHANVLTNMIARLNYYQKTAK